MHSPHGGTTLFYLVIKRYGGPALSALICHTMTLDFWIPPEELPAFPTRPATKTRFTGAPSHHLEGKASTFTISNKSAVSLYQDANHNGPLYFYCAFAELPSSDGVEP